MSSTMVDKFSAVQLDFLENLLNIPAMDERVSQEGVLIGPSRVPLEIVRNKRAKRYIIRLLPELVLRVTIPRGGSKREALRFVSENIRWVEKQFQSHRLQEALDSSDPALLKSIFYQGRRVPVVTSDSSNPFKRFGYTEIPTGAIIQDEVAIHMEDHLEGLAREILPATTQRLAKRFGFHPKRVSIRNQKTRWGSCSSSGTISLNWRLIQVPSFVREYVILHELTHLEHLNHSNQFWDRLAKLCPNHRAAESWLKKYSHRIR